MPFLLPAAATAVKVGASAAVAGASTAAVAGATVAAKVGIMATLKAVAFNALTSAAISAAMSALQPQVGSAGRTFEWTLDPNAPIPFAAGRVGVAGTVCHLETYGPDKMYYGFVSVLSGAGPIRAITGFKGDDESVAFDANGKAISSQWANEMWFRSRLGTQPDTALTNPPGLKNNAQLPGWTAAHKLSGKACYMLVLGENSKRTAYPTGEPKPLVTVEGLFGWDPRQDSTWPGGVGPCRLNDPSTWVWLDNPILWGLKWALGLWEGPLGKGAPGVDYQVGGIGAKVEGIRVDRFVAAANVADANGWKVAAYPTTDDDKSQVLDAFLQAGGAMYALEQGKISCIQRAAPRVSVATITAEDTAGPLAIDTAASRIDRINTIRPRFWSEAHRWQLTAIDDVTAQVYRDEDGAVRPRGIDFPYVPLATQAGQLAALQIANTREPIAGTIPLKPHMRNVAPGTAFTISEPGFLLDGLKCLCLNTDYDPATGVVTVTFVSETDAKYPFALGQSPNPPAPPVLVAPDLTVTPPQPGEWTLAAATFQNDGVSVPALLFSGSVENSRALSAIFEFRPVGAVDWSGAGIEDPTVTRKEAAGGLLTPGVQYEGAVSYRVGGNISDRLILGPVTAGDLVVGDIVPVTPANVAGTPTLAITTATLPDGTQTSRLYGSWAEAAEATSYLVEFDDGSITWTEPAAESAITEKIVVTGPPYRYRVKALSRTGHLSAAWSNWSATVAAGGDTTAPGPVTSPDLVPLARRIVLRWVNPTDKDYSHLKLYRNSTGAGPASGDYRGEVRGSIFADTDVTAGVPYYYWGVTVDRTGNEGAIIYFGMTTPGFVSVGGGDVATTDPVLVTQYGISSGFQGQGSLATKNAALWGSDISARPPMLTDTVSYSGISRIKAGYLFSADGAKDMESYFPQDVLSNRTENRTSAGFTGQGSLATRNDVDFDTHVVTYPSRLRPNPTYGGAYFDPTRVIYGTGAEIDALRPGEFGSNVTENRTAAAIAGQAAWATATGIPTARVGLLDNDGRMYAGYQYYSTGDSVQSLRPGELGANVTENRTSAAIVNQSRFATAGSISLADDDVAAPWTALESRPALTQGNSLTEDPAFSDPSSWIVAGAGAALVSGLSWGRSGTTAFRTGQGVPGDVYGARGVPVDPNKTYMIEGWYIRDGASNGFTYGGVDLIDGNDTSIQGDGTYWLYNPSSAVLPEATWTYSSKVFGAGTNRPLPSNAVQMRPLALLNYNGTAGYQWVQGLRIVEVVRIGGNFYRTDGTLATEPDVITAQGTAAAFQGQGSLATRNDVGWNDHISGRPAALRPEYMLSGDYLAGNMVYYAGLTESVQGLKPQEAGANVTEGRTAAAIVGQAPTATDSSFGAITAVPSRLDAHPTFGGNYLNHNRLIYADGTGVEQRKPQEAGANVTEARTAAAIASQGPGATAPANRVMNDRYVNSVRYVSYPDGGQYNGAGAGFENGQLQITLPYGFVGTGSNAMIRFAVDIYDYISGGTVTYIIGGYTYSPDGVTPQWVNTSASYVGPRSLAKPVKLGHYNGLAYIWIGDVGTSWAYMSARVRDVQINYSGVAASGWDTNWSMSLNNTDISSLVLVNYPASTVAAVQAVFGENALEDSSGTPATLPNFKTPLGTAAAVAGQGPLTTQTPPTYAGNSAAFAALGAGRSYLDSSDSYKLATSYDPNSLTTGFGADISHTVRFGSRVGAGTGTTSVTSIQNVRNAAGDVTYSWARISGDATMSATSPASASTAFSAALTAGQTKTATFRCTISDGTNTVFKDCTATVAEIS